MKYLPFIIYFILQSLLATSYPMPDREKIFSQSKDFFVIVDPNLKKHCVYATDNPDKSLWCFSLDVWHYSYVLSNDGTTVAVVFWEHLKEEDIPDFTALAFYRNGKFVRKYKLNKIFPNPPKTQDITIGPIGNFWRTWYKDIAQDDNNLFIKLSNNKIVTFSLETCKLINTPKFFPKNEINKINKIQLKPLDTDNDQIPDHIEVKYKLDPNKKDSLDLDKDGFSNQDEILHGSELNEATSHPDIIYTCKVISSNKDSATILVTLTGEKVTIKPGEIFFLKNRAGISSKYKLLQVNFNIIKVASFSMGEVLNIGVEPNLKTIP